MDGKDRISQACGKTIIQSGRASICTFRPKEVLEVAYVLGQIHYGLGFVELYQISRSYSHARLHVLASSTFKSGSFLGMYNQRLEFS
jgi:hypothetical protein